MLDEFAPDVVIGVGGYASGPAMLAAVTKHIPSTLAFEPNVVPGLRIDWSRALSSGPPFI